MSEPLPLLAAEIIDKLLDMQREAHNDVLRAVYGSKPFWMSFDDAGNLVVKPIEPEEFFAKAIEARQRHDPEEGHGPQDESAVAESHSPKTPPTPPHHSLGE